MPTVSPLYTILPKQEFADRSRNKQAMNLPTDSASTTLTRRHFLSAGLLVTLPVRAISRRADATDDFVRAQMDTQHVPAVSVAVVQKGKVLLARGYGVANRAQNVAATAATPYKIASVSKQFFATAILVLAQDGKLSLNDPVFRYLEGTPETWKAITLRHLLSHTAGLVREAPAFAPFKPQPDADVVRSAYPVPLVFAPGEKWQYSNVGYFAIAEVIRVVSGKPWAEFIKNRVFIPAKMTETRTTAEATPNRAIGYSYADNDWQIAPDYTALRPSGAFVSTVEDLARWDAALYTDAVLNAQSRRALWTPTSLNNGTTTPYGLGWQLQTVRGLRRAEHGGSLPGFRSHVLRGLGDGLSVMVLTNTGQSDPAVIASGVARLHTPL